MHSSTYLSFITFILHSFWNQGHSDAHSHMHVIITTQPCVTSMLDSAVVGNCIWNGEKISQVLGFTHRMIPNVKFLSKRDWISSLISYSRHSHDKLENAISFFHPTRDSFWVVFINVDVQKNLIVWCIECLGWSLNSQVFITLNQLHECCLLCLTVFLLSLIHIWRCRRGAECRSRWSPYH